MQIIFHILNNEFSISFCSHFIRSQALSWYSLFNENYRELDVRLVEIRDPLTKGK